MEDLEAQPFTVLVINLPQARVRCEQISSHLTSLNLNFRLVKACASAELAVDSLGNVARTAEAVWLSHKTCFEEISSLSHPVLILEDDAQLTLSKSDLNEMCKQMETSSLDLIQVGFLTLNKVERFSILGRNLYSFFVKNALFPNLFKKLGFEEVSRIAPLHWRKNLPAEYVINDLRYGAHAYLISPAFAGVLLQLNDPVFLAIDNLLVSLSKMKSFKVVRLKRSKAHQNGLESSFSKRYGIEE